MGVEKSLIIDGVNGKLFSPDFNFLFFFCLMVMVGVQPSFAQKAEIFGGVAQVEITPREKGYPHYRGASTGTHDPLFAKAMVLMEGDEKLALLVCDLLWIERDLSVKVRMKIEEETGIPYQNIIVSATHTHTGPAYHPNIRELTGKLRIPFDTIHNTGENDSYPSWLAQKMVEAVTDAHNNALPVNLVSGSGKAGGIAFNRRFLMKDGKVVTNPGIENPQISRTTGPIDPMVELMLIRRKSDDLPIGSLTNFAVHADTFGGTAFGADYPGYLAQELAFILGDQLVSVFAAGACGNINHV
ncbi:MAG TPA: neutral/alkaline non-lysosomal ceramidase N-terminal domain-containing protein, partial [Lunatimonas sp.]|nr:neutral/alkaline non-lysosomal ceramidase N-terminal domain-containing protein [Lunatimonas sp.]